MFKKKDGVMEQEADADKKPGGQKDVLTPESQKTEEPASLSVGADGLKELIEKNIKWSQVIYNQNKQIKGRLTMIAALAWLKVFLILVPIVLGIIFLPSLVRDAWSQYGELLFEGGENGDFSNIINQLSPEQIREGMKFLQNKN